MTTRSWWKTGVGLALTAVMLFPVYWMLNASFTRDQDLRKSPPDLFPAHATLEGYRAVVDQQLPYLGTSLVIGLGTVALTVALAAPVGYALAKLQLGLLQSVPGLIVADSTLAVPFAVLIFTAFMSGIPGELLQAAQMDGAGP
ncbi:carbohydrate ABC transporter permease, partial [Streptomyces sp. NPDC001617]